MRVCPNCFNDIELKRFITSNSSEMGDCDYCSSGVQTDLIEVTELLDFFAEFIEIFDEDSNGFPLLNLIESDWNLFSDSSKTSNLLTTILSFVESNITDTFQKVNYIDEIIECTSYWEVLKEDLKWKRRFLTDINQIVELGWDSFFDKQSELSSEANLYRARIHKNAGQEKFPINKMGSPIRERSTGGRANPQGIPYLYLSESIETTLYETRGTYLDEISIGKFTVNNNEKVVLVDFTESISAFLNIGDIIDYAKSVLLKKNISTDLSKPIRRYDSELEYIPTQFICEFIRYVTGADGILFDSSLHKGGKNIVLFEQGQVECVSVEKHKVTKINIISSVMK